MGEQRLIEEICETLQSAQNGAGRVLAALAGPPGAGKSTFSSKLVSALKGTGDLSLAAVVPMDGFHLENDVLQARGLLQSKGAPETFDVSGFVDLVRQVRRDDGPVAYPLFDRAADRTIAGAATLEATTRFVIFEGNYLLLQKGAWAQLAALFDVTIMLHVDAEKLRARLVRRWIEHGLDQNTAVARADGNDMQNAQLVLAHSGTPDLKVITLPDDQLVLETQASRAGMLAERK